MSGRLISTAVSWVAPSRPERSPPSASDATLRSAPERKPSNQAASTSRGSSRTSTNFMRSGVGSPKREADIGTSARRPDEKQKSWKTLVAPPG